MMHSWIFSITPVFSVTRSFRNHYDVLIIINVENMLNIFVKNGIYLLFVGFIVE